MTANKKIGVAFLGAGTVAEMHGRGIQAISGASFLGAYDVDRQKADALSSRFGGAAYASLEDILADERVDAVHLLTPVEQHVPHAVACMRAGKHVLVEKPVAEDHEGIAQLEAVAAETGRICMPAHNYIYAPSVRRAKQLIQSGKLGRIASLWILYNIFHSEQVAAVYGGVLRAVCTHHAYSLLYLLGRPTRVTAITSRVHYRELRCEDQAMIVCELPDGSIANLWTSFAASDPTNDPWTVLYKVLGTNGGVSYSWNEAQFHDDGGPAWGMPCYEESFVAEIDHFLNRCVAGGEQPLSTLRDAADALSILQAAERSVLKTDAFERIRYGIDKL
jgi:predicted dehydrogenase